MYVYSPQEQTRTTEKIDRNRKKEKKMIIIHVHHALSKPAVGKLLLVHCFLFLPTK